MSSVGFCPAADANAVEKEDTRRKMFWASFLCVSPYIPASVPNGQKDRSCSGVMKILFSWDFRLE